MEFIAGMEAKMAPDEAKRFASTAGYVQFQKQWKTQARGRAMMCLKLYLDTKNMYETMVLLL